MPHTETTPALCDQHGLRLRELLGGYLHCEQGCRISWADYSPARCDRHSLPWASPYQSPQLRCAEGCETTWAELRRKVEREPGAHLDADRWRKDPVVLVEVLEPVLCEAHGLDLYRDHSSKRLVTTCAHGCRFSGYPHHTFQGDPQFTAAGRLVDRTWKGQR